MDLLVLFLSFCGGILGAAIGGLASFILCGVAGLIGIALSSAGVQFDWLGIVSFGPVFGPHIAFAGGVGAAAFAKKIKVLETGKDTVTALISIKKISVLLVGGVFGAFGYVCAFVIGKILPGRIDGVALTVMISAIIAKLVFTGELFGKVGEEDKKLGGRFSPLAKSAWVDYMTTAAQKTILAVAFGGLSAYITHLMLLNEQTAAAAVFFGFCISATSLIFLQFGTAVPVTHHITLCAAYGVVASGGNILWGIAAAIIAAFLGDFLARLFCCYGDVHIDPPAMSIAATSLILLGILPNTGIFNLQPAIIVLPVIAIALVYSFLEYNWINKKSLQS
ncbi:MAG: hypothetical protein CVV02_11595 [Firmicutes bacterium HGW-Firmicutes-7]|nr:MAG: hypothetical protein CVV02_11595 [Firmicutes bacterium HGW-Firmicutes-7]